MALVSVQDSSRAPRQLHVMQIDPVTCLAIFHKHLAAQSPSSGTFDYLREQSLVSRATNNHVQHLLGDDNWRASWLRRAHEFTRICCNSSGAMLPS